jgi:hypothetical protein
VNANELSNKFANYFFVLWIFDMCSFAMLNSNLYACMYCSGGSCGFYGECALSYAQIHNSINCVYIMPVTTHLQLALEFFLGI